MKRVMVLGSTGSIGRNTLDIIGRMPGEFRATALSCRSRISEIAAQAAEFKPEAVAVNSIDFTAGDLRQLPPAVQFYSGEEGLLKMIEEVDADIVVNGISGARGLLPSFKTLECGMDLALANKETVVMAGSLITELARKRNQKLIPVDSEHAALFSLLESAAEREVAEVILTASGGAFRDFTTEQLQDVRVVDALNHPNWQMGPKITVDSATMANKGLEVIEAHYLFSIAVDKIKVLIHPQSYVHAMIRTIEGSLYAQISKPDMRLPILNALSYPRLFRADFADLELGNRELSFLPVDYQKYPLLALAYEAVKTGSAHCVVYNAANEVAVEAFLKERISFLEIAAVVEDTLNLDWYGSTATLEDILDIDQRARVETERFIK